MYPGLVKSTGLVFAEKPSIGVEPANLPDRSRFGNHGTHTDITMVQLPSGLWVRDFNGATSLITIPDTPSLRPQNFITIMMWAEFHQISFPAASNILGKGDRGSPINEYAFYTDAENDLWFGAALGAVPAWNSAEVILDVIQDTWLHLVVTYDGANFQGYKNSVAGPPSAKTGTMRSDRTEPLTIGKVTNTINGRLGLIKIFQYALSVEQIAARFQAERRWFGV